MPDTESEEEFANLYSLLVLFTIWALFMVAITISNITSYQNITEIYDKCTENDVKYRYFVKIDLNPMTRKRFNLYKNILTIRIKNPTNIYISTFNIRLAILQSAPDLEKRLRVSLTLIINRSEAYTEWGFIAIESSAQKGTIYLYDMEMIGIDTKDHYYMVIERDISAQNVKKLGNEFQCKPMKWDPNIDLGKPTKSLLVLEVLSFLYVSSTITTFFAVITSLSKNDNIICAIISAFLGFLIEFAIILFYRFYLKENYCRTYGAKQWDRWTQWYLIICFAMAMVFSTITVVILITNSKKTIQIILISLLMFIIFNILLIIISFLFKCRIFGPIVKIKSYSLVDSIIERKKGRQQLTTPVERPTPKPAEESGAPGETDPKKSGSPGQTDPKKSGSPGVSEQSKTHSSTDKS